MAGEKYCEYKGQKSHFIIHLNENSHKALLHSFCQIFDHLIWLPKWGKPFLPNQVEAIISMFKRHNSSLVSAGTADT